MVTAVYIDMLFFENFLLDFFILYVTSKINNVRFKILGGILGSTAGALYVCLIYISDASFLNSRFLKLLIIPVMLFLTFKIRNWKEFLKFIFTYTAVCFVLAGGIYFVSEIRGKMNILSVFAGALMLLFMGKELFMLIKYAILKKENTKDTLLFYNDKIMKLRTFEDTGNFLVDPISRRSVVIVSKNKIKKITDISNISKIKNVRLIPCRTVADKFELLYGFKPDKFIYGGREVDAVVAISKEDFCDEGYDAILNPLTLV